MGWNRTAKKSIDPAQQGIIKAIARQGIAKYMTNRISHTELHQPIK